MSIRAKLIFLLSISVLLPVVFIAIIITINLRTTSVEDFESSADQQVRLVNSLIELYLDGLKEDAVFFTKTPQIKALTAQTTKYMGVSGEQMTPLQNSKEEKEAFEIMSSFGEAHGDLAYVFLALDTGGYIQWPTSEANDYDPRARPWYQQADGQSSPVLTKPYKDVVTGAPIIDYLVPFQTNSGINGVFGVDVTLEKLATIVNGVQFGEGGYVVLTEEDGTVLANPKNIDLNFQLLSETDDPLSAIESSPLGLTEVEIADEQWFVQKYKSDALNWYYYGLIPKAEVMAQANRLFGVIVAISALFVVVFIGMGYVLIARFTAPLYDINESLKSISEGEGDLTSELTTASNDEVGQLAQSFNNFLKSIRVMVRSIQDTGQGVGMRSTELHDKSSELRKLVHGQSESLDLISTAFEEMVATANEVSRNCSEAAESANNSQIQVNEGQESLRKTVDSVSKLTELLADSNSDMNQLSYESNNIESILDTIRGIAEQTNLLALNAAIEAARAGEQGRGFAVVADEVRTLASRTSDSTEEISKLLNGLRNLVSTVSSKTSESLENAEESQKLTNGLEGSLSQVFEGINSIKDMTTQIATSAEEQHQVAEHINQNIVNVKNSSTDTEDIAGSANAMSDELKDLSTNLMSLVDKFKV